MANVLIHPANRTALREMAILGQAIEEAGHFHCIFLVENGPVAEMAHELRLSSFAGDFYITDIVGCLVGAEKMVPGVMDDAPTASIQRAQRISPLAVLHERFSTNGPVRLLAGMLKRYRQRKNVTAFVDKFAAAVIILGNNRHHGLELPLVDAARRQGVPTLIVPYGYSGQADLAVSRSRNPAYWLGSVPHRVLKRFLKFFRPDNLFDINGKELFYYDPVEMLTLLLSRMLPRRPWVLGASGITRIAVAGKEDKERLVARGVDASRIAVTGMASHDILFKGAADRRGIRDRLVREYGLHRDRPVIVWAIPQMAEEGFLDWETHWREIEAVAELFDGLDAEILVSLHPKAQAAAYDTHLAPFGLKIMHDDLSKNLPGADLFIAGHSTTIHWAILLGIPVFITDFFDLGYDMYKHVGDVSIVTGKPELRDAIQRRLVEAPPGWNGGGEERSAADSLGVLDGEAVARLQGLVEDLAISG